MRERLCPQYTEPQLKIYGVCAQYGHLLFYRKVKY